MKKIIVLLILGFASAIGLWHYFSLSLNSKAILEPYYKTPADISFAPGGKILAIANPGELIIYNMLTDKLITRFSLPPIKVESGKRAQLLWSPDGKKIAVGIVSTDKKDLWATDYHLFDISEKRKINTYSNLWLFYWNPDSQRFGVHDRTTSYLGSIGSAKLYPMKHGQIVGWLDTDRLVYLIKKEGDLWFGIGNLQNGNFQEIEPIEDFVSMNSISKIIAYRPKAEERLNDGLKLYFVETRKTKLVVNDPVSEDEIYWSPDGSKFVFVEYAEDRDTIWLYDVIKEQLSKTYAVISAKGYDEGISKDIKWTDNGKDLVFISSKTNYLYYSKLLVHIYNLETRKHISAKLPIDKHLNPSFMWSPDGRRVYYYDINTNKLMEIGLKM